MTVISKVFLISNYFKPFPGRKNLCKKCAEMRWFFKKFSTKTLQKMRWNVLKCAETLKETRCKPLSFQRIAVTENRTRLSGAAVLTYFQNFSAHFLRKS